MQTRKENFIVEYNLYPFAVNVFSKEQTLLEKLISLVRCSFDENPVESISGKIRHFYDLYFLINNPECAAFVASDSFKNRFNTILQHDKVLFGEPKGWQNKLIDESPLVIDFASIWKQINGKYQTEFTALAYRPIPNEKDISAIFSELIKRIK